MSRILRRPMFRGGRVDSRGTGITSGLCYEKGGRVGYKDAGAVTGGQISEEALAKIMGKRGTLLGDVNRGLTKGSDFLYNNILRPAGNLPYGISDYVFGTEFGLPIKERNTFAEYLEAFGGADKILGNMPAVTGVDMPPGGGRTSQGTGEDYVKPKTKINNNNNNNNNNETSTDDLMGIDKEKFAKLLGSKEARGEDISNMLMSFAGKALKPEATVKSAFGEFFEEEAKRPSSKTKIDQAAAQLAINKYIKGEISKAEMEKLVMLNRTKISDQIALQKAALTLDTALQAGVKNQVGSSKKSIAVIQSAVEQVYGDKFNFGGPLPETAEEINVSTIYVKDNEKSSGAKDLVYIDPTTGNLEILKTIF